MQKANLHLLNESTQADAKSRSAQVVQNKATTNNSSGLTPALSYILQEVQRELGYDNFDKDGEEAAASSGELEKLINRIAEKLGFELSAFERDELLAQIESNQRPFGILQELVDDSQVSDIIVHDYAHIEVLQGRSTCSTDLSFPNQASYEAFVERLLQKAGSTYSTKKPIADGMIGSYARVHVVHKALCASGPYLTIRINRFGRVSTKDLVEFGSAPKEIYNYLSGIVKIGKTLLVVGEVGSGKTTLVRAVASNIPLDECILVIEDTPEIRLEHPHVRYVTTREANTDGAGRVSPCECIRAGMRMAMNRIIFGEMRDAEAAEAFIDVCASGHPGLSTIHARSGSEAITRLELFLGRAQKGVDRRVLSEQISTAVQAIVFVDMCRITKKRRVMEVIEVGAAADGVLRQREIFRYIVKDGLPKWRVVNKVSNFKNDLEELETPVRLSAWPNVLELDNALLYKEAVNLRS